MKVIIFDFDGVIIDSFNFGKKLLKELGLNISDETWKDHHNGNVFEAPKVPFQENNLGDKYDKLYLKNVNECSSFFNENDLQELLKDKKLFIISSNREKGIIKFLNDKKLNYFTEILGGAFNKSKVKKFEYILKKYNLNNNDCIFVTDTLGDINEANKIGIKTIAVTFGFHDRKKLETGKPLLIVDSVLELLNVLKNDSIFEMKNNVKFVWILVSIFFVLPIVLFLIFINI